MNPTPAECAAPTVAAVETDASGRRIWRVGSLVYTQAGLAALFFWLLWIDFTFTLMEAAFKPILQFKLNNELSCDPRLYAIFMVTGPSTLGFFLSPIVSVHSDRHRGPRGRRIPYLLYATPFACLFLALMGFGNEIAAYLHAHVFAGMPPATVAVWTFGLLFLGFTVFNTFLGSVFYYLFNDVVPREHIVKFMGYFRAVGTLAGMVYSWFIFGYSDKTGPLSINLGFWSCHIDQIWYPKIILVGMAVFYLVAFSVACLKVKEPDYPPPPPLARGDRFLARFGSTLITLFRECFTHPFYLLFFFTMTVEWMIHQANDFSNPMLKNLNLDLYQVGRVNTWCGLATLVLTVLTANYGDKFNAVPLSLWALVGLVVTAPIGLLFLIPGLSAGQYMGIYMAYQATHIPVGVVWGMAMWPLFFQLLPRDRYGQFSSAMVMCRSLFAGILGSMAAGWVFALLKAAHGGGGYYNRYFYAWRMLFQVLALLCFIALYRKWKRMGGREGFAPPPVITRPPAATGGASAPSV